MKTSFLEFEQPIAELEAKIEQLRFVQDDSAVDISEEISRLDAKNQSLTKEIYAKLGVNSRANFVKLMLGLVQQRQGYAD